MFLSPSKCRPRGVLISQMTDLTPIYVSKMVDSENSMVHFTGVWKALGHQKADVVRLIESEPAGKLSFLWSCAQKPARAWA